MIAVILVTHGVFGQELLRTAQDIVGRQESVAAISVTPDVGLEGLAKSIEEVLKDMNSPDGFLFLVDMLGGTPCNTVLLKTKTTPAEVVTGVNLYMVISAVTHRTEMNFKALAAKVLEDGKRAIALPKDLLLKRLG